MAVNRQRLNKLIGSSLSLSLRVLATSSTKNHYMFVWHCYAFHSDSQNPKMNTNNKSPSATAALTGRLPDLPADESVWDGPFRGEDEVKEEPVDESHSPCGEQGESQDSQPWTPTRVAANSTTEWSPLPSPAPSPAPNHHNGSASIPAPPMSPMGLREVAKGTVQFHSGFVDHLIDALDHSSLGHDEVCVHVTKTLTAIEERALRRLNPEALRYMTGALRMPIQARPQPQQHSYKRRSSKSPTKSERKARAKAARRRSSSSGCGPDCGHPKGPNKRDDREDPPSYTPLFPMK